ncbi:MAG: hypothetical protein GXY83_10630 [Rhodopirellula sp.]|nr:hypothetical protein [Rhodopirellula sp.]
MDELLRRLLNRLEGIGKVHEELYDSEVREQMSEAVFQGFIRMKDRYEAPGEFGLHTPEANREVRDALLEYIGAATVKANDLRLSSFHERLRSFQNSKVESDGDGAFFDDFFGYSPPDMFDSAGNVTKV